jgi:hypothetical protein
LDRSLVGFSAGFFWGKTLLLVPNRNAQGAVKGKISTRKALKGSYLRRSQHGKLVGIDLTKNFDDLSSVSVLDLSTVTRQQIPKIPDPELRGFVGGFASGDYAYLVPHSNGYETCIYSFFDYISLFNLLFCARVIRILIMSRCA